MTQKEIDIPYELQNEVFQLCTLIENGDEEMVTEGIKGLLEIIDTLDDLGMDQQVEWVCQNKGIALAISNGRPEGDRGLENMKEKAKDIYPSIYCDPSDDFREQNMAKFK